MRSSYRLLSGVRSIGFHVDPAEVVGGSRVLSGTVVKLGRMPPRGPCSWKMPPLRPVFDPGVLPMLNLNIFACAQEIAAL